MHAIFRAALFGVALFWASDATAQVLWQEAEVGMSEENVLAAFPSAKPEENGHKLGDGSRELIRISKYELFGKEFVVRFFFNSDGLEQVTISLQSHSNAHEAELVFDNLVSALRGKYGQETLLKEDTNSIMSGQRAEWFTKGIKIVIIQIAIGKDRGLLNLNYQGDAGEEAKKL